MIRLLAYKVEVQAADVIFRVIRVNNRGSLVEIDAPLCAGLARKRNGWARKGAGAAVVANANGLRAIRQYYRDVAGDFIAIYGRDGEPYKTVCAAVETFLGYVPGGAGCQ